MKLTVRRLIIELARMVVMGLALWAAITGRWEIAAAVVGYCAMTAAWRIEDHITHKER